MEIFLLVIAGLCMLIGIIGCIVPGLPGVPIAYADYVVPAWGTKQFGGTKWGVVGSTIGVFAGLFFGPVGVIAGPLVGAVLGELLGGKQVAEAIRAGWGSFVGLLFGTILKLICCGLMTSALIRMIW